jgi:hypothetical protein
VLLICGVRVCVCVCVKFAFDITILSLFYKIFLICEDRNKGYLGLVFRADTQFTSKHFIDLVQHSIRRCLCGFYVYVFY